MAKYRDQVFENFSFFEKIDVFQKVWLIFSKDGYLARAKSLDSESPVEMLIQDGREFYV